MVSPAKTEEDAALLTDTESDCDQEGSLPEKQKSSNNKWLLGPLFMSAIINVILVLFLARSSYIEPPSKYAGLWRNIEEPYVRVTKYASENETLQTQLWHDINIDSGVVALSDEWATKHNLRTAQRFPWDQNKGVYILHGFHNLHCLKIVHISLDEYRRGEPQSRSWHHISHCMDALRRQILCDADDTPRATERRAEVVTGLLQHRKCRSWEALEKFAKEHTACYKRPDRPDDTPIIERFKHCPPGSGYTITDNYVPSDKFLVGLPGESIEEE